MVITYTDTPLQQLAHAFEQALLTDPDPAGYWTGNLNDRQLKPLLATLPTLLSDTAHTAATKLLQTLMTTLHDGAALLWHEKCQHHGSDLADLPPPPPARTH